MGEAVKIRKKADSKILKICQNYFRDNGGRILDVGAHVGKFESKIASNKPLYRIAVEPNRKAIEVLESKFPGITIVPCAVGWPEGVATMYETEKYQGVNCSIFKESASKLGLPLRPPFQVKKVSLDSVYNEFEGSVDLLFLNCEGGEYEIFQGPVEFLKRTKMVYVHLHTKCSLFLSKEYSKKRKRIVQLLNSADFKMIAGMKDRDSLAHVVQLWKK